MSRSQHYPGFKNFLVRQYFYLQRGLTLLNELRYLVMAIFATYYTLKLSNPWFMVLMFLVAIPALIVFGWLTVHHMAKTLDWLNIEYSTYWSRYGFKLQEEIRDAVRSLKPSEQMPTNNSFSVNPSAPINKAPIVANIDFSRLGHNAKLKRTQEQICEESEQIFRSIQI